MVYVLSAKRTPIGRYGGTLRDTHPAELGAVAVRAALEDARVSGDLVDEVVIGHARQAGTHAQTDDAQGVDRELAAIHETSFRFAPCSTGCGTCLDGTTYFRRTSTESMPLACSLVRTSSACSRCAYGPRWSHTR